MLKLIGEIRKVEETTVTPKQGQAFTKYMLVVEPESGINNFVLNLTKDAINAGFPKQLKQFKGKTCEMEVFYYFKNGYLTWYLGKQLPQEIK